ncbi:hypothetical protein, partial [Klebsiella pneumoniae]
MIKNIADYYIKVVINFLNKTIFPGTVMRICPNDRF